MAEDQGKEEEKFDFTPEGEVIGYISLDQALLQARRIVRLDESRYLKRLGWNEIVWTESRIEKKEDSYVVVLQFQSPTKGLGEKGLGEEEFIFDLTGELQERQVVVWPSNTIDEDATNRLLAGDKFNDQREFELAIAEYNEVLRIEPQNHTAQINRGRAFSGLGQLDQAIMDYDEAIRIDPLGALAYNHRGFAYAGLGKLTRAIEDFAEAIRHKFPYGDSYVGRGAAYTDLGKYHRAIEDFDESIRLWPENPLGYLGRGDAYFLLNQPERAIEDYIEVLCLYPEWGQPYEPQEKVVNCLGKQLRHNVEAIIRANPESPKAFTERGHAYECLGQYQKAIESFDQAIRLDPQESKNYSYAGNTRSHLGEYAKAIEYYSHAIQLWPEYSMSYHYRGYALLQECQYQQAIEDFNEAIRRNGGGWAPGFFERGVAYSRLGNHQQAIENYSEAIRIYYGDYNPQHSDYDEIEALFESLANRAKAFTWVCKDDEAQLDVEQAVGLEHMGANRGELETAIDEIKKTR